MKYKNILRVSVKKFTNPESHYVQDIMRATMWHMIQTRRDCASVDNRLLQQFQYSYVVEQRMAVFREQRTALGLVVPKKVKRRKMKLVTYKNT